MDNLNTLNTTYNYNEILNVQNNVKTYDISTLMTLIIVIAVLIFVVKIVKSFYDAYKENFVESENDENKQLDEKNISAKLRGEINKQNNIRYRTCVYCGIKNDFDSKFCKNCGKRIR